MGQRSYVNDSVSDVSCSAAVSESVAASMKPRDGRQPVAVSDIHLVVLAAMIADGKARCLQKGGIHPEFQERETQTRERKISKKGGEKVR